MGSRERASPATREKRLTASNMPIKRRRLACGCMVLYRSSPPRVGEIVLCITCGTGQTVTAVLKGEGNG